MKISNPVKEADFEMSMDETMKQRFLVLIGKGQLGMVIGELLRMDLGSRRNHLVIAISSRFEDHRINQLKGITTPAEDRLVASQITNALLEFLKDPPRQEKGRGAWSKGWWMVILLTGIIALLPAALTWEAQLPPFTAPPVTALKNLGNPSPPEPSKDPVSSKDAILPKARKIFLSGALFDDRTGVQLEGVKVCAVAYDKHGLSISSQICISTNELGHFEIKFNIPDAETIEMNVDGSAIGYSTRSISMDPKSETSGRQLLLKKL